jgi:F-type H+-transporting ATPase subunit b
MEEFIETFHIDWKLMIAQIINFGLVFVALYLIAAKPLKKLMEDRTREITTGLEDAKSNAEMLKNTKKEYEEIISKARIEANSIFETGKTEALVKKQAMLEEAKNEVNGMIEAGKKNLLNEKNKMVEDAKREIISLVIKSTEKVVGGKVDEQVIKKELGSL